MATPVADPYSYETYAGRVGETFRIHAERTVDATLHDVRSAPRRDGYTSGFSLSFVAPGEVLPQGTYRFEHDEIGPLDIFIVPVGRRGDDVEYEAVFT